MAKQSLNHSNWSETKAKASPWKWMTVTEERQADWSDGEDANDSHRDQRQRWTDRNERTRMTSIGDVSSSVEWVNLFQNRRGRKRTIGCCCWPSLMMGNRTERFDWKSQSTWEMWTSCDTDTSFIPECSSSCRGEEEGHSKSSSSRQKLFVIFIFIFNQANGKDQTKEHKFPWNHWSFRSMKWWRKDEEQTLTAIADKFLSYRCFSSARDERSIETLLQSTSSRHRRLPSEQRSRQVPCRREWFGHEKVQGTKPSSRRLRVFFLGRLALTRRTDGQTSNHLIGKRMGRGMRTSARSMWSEILPSIRQMFPGEWTIEMRDPFSSPRDLPEDDQIQRQTNRSIISLGPQWKQRLNQFILCWSPSSRSKTFSWSSVNRERESRWGLSSQRQRGLECDRSVRVVHSTSTITVDLVDTSTLHWEKREGISRVKALFHWSSLTSFERWRHSSGSAESLLHPIGIARSPKLSISLIDGVDQISISRCSNNSEWICAVQELLGWRSDISQNGWTQTRISLQFSFLSLRHRSKRKSHLLLIFKFGRSSSPSPTIHSTEWSRQQKRFIFSSLVLWSNFHCSPICWIVQHQWRTTEIALWHQSEGREREGRRVIWQMEMALFVILRFHLEWWKSIVWWAERKEFLFTSSRIETNWLVNWSTESVEQRSSEIINERPFIAFHLAHPNEHHREFEQNWQMEREEIDLIIIHKRERERGRRTEEAMFLQLTSEKGSALWWSSPHSPRQTIETSKQQRRRQRREFLLFSRENKFDVSC